MAEVEARVEELQAKQLTVIVCRSGGRSNTITQLLNAHGVNAVNLEGGMRAWEQAGLPVVTGAGEPGHIL